jgi:hypothetical protein
MDGIAWVVFAYVVTYGFVITYVVWMHRRRRKLEITEPTDQT